MRFFFFTIKKGGVEDDLIKQISQRLLKNKTKLQIYFFRLEENEF